MTHKRLLLFFFLSLALLFGRAEGVAPWSMRPEFKRSWGITFGGGAYHTMAYTPNAKLFTGVFALDVKRQFSPALALGLEGNMLLPNQNLLQSHSSRGLIYLYGGINLVNLFATAPPNPRRVELEGLVSIGWGHNFKEESANRDLGASYLVSKLGVNLNWYLNAERSWALNVRPALFYDLRTDKENTQIEYNIQKASMMVSVGFMYRWGAGEYSRSQAYFPSVPVRFEDEKRGAKEADRSTYVLPQAAADGKRSRSRTLPTPAMALDAVQRSDLQPTTRAVAESKRTAMSYADSARRVVQGNREAVTANGHSATAQAQKAEASGMVVSTVSEQKAVVGTAHDAAKADSRVVYYSPEEYVVNHEPVKTVVRGVKQATPAVDSSGLVVRATASMGDAEVAAATTRPARQKNNRAEERAEAVPVVRQTAHQAETSAAHAPSTPVVTREDGAGGVVKSAGQSVETVNQPWTERAEKVARRSEQSSRAEQRQEQGAGQQVPVKPSQRDAVIATALPPVHEGVVIETPDPVAPVPELDVESLPAMPIVVESPLQNEAETSQTDEAASTPRRASTKKTHTEEFDIYFAAGSAAVSGTPLEEVVRLANYLRRNPSAKVTLSGYVSVGENKVLARRRVEGVRALLVGRYGVDVRRVRATANGVAYFSPQSAKNRVVVAYAGD